MEDVEATKTTLKHWKSAFSSAILMVCNGQLIALTTFTTFSPINNYHEMHDLRNVQSATTYMYNAHTSCRLSTLL